MIVRDAYPIPKMDKCIDNLGDSKVFSTLDAISGYWLILISAKDRDMTTFTTNFGTYVFMRMSFWAEECTNNVPTGHWHDTNHCQVAVRPGVPRRHHSILFLFRVIQGSPQYSIGASGNTRRNPTTVKFQVLPNRSAIPRAHNQAERL